MGKKVQNFSESENRSIYQILRSRYWDVLVGRKGVYIGYLGRWIHFWLQFLSSWSFLWWFWLRLDFEVFGHLVVLWKFCYRLSGGLLTLGSIFYHACTQLIRVFKSCISKPLSVFHFLKKLGSKLDPEAFGPKIEIFKFLHQCFLMATDG